VSHPDNLAASHPLRMESSPPALDLTTDEEYRIQWEAEGEIAKN